MRLLFVKSFLTVSSWLPLPAIHLLGVFVGWVLILVPSRLSRDSRTNISLCLPTLDSGHQRRLVRKSLVETGKTLLETGALWLRPGPRALRLIRSVDGLEVVQAGVEQGRGIILATPHLGAWEAAGLYGAATFNMTCLYRPLRVRELEELVRSARNRLGAHFVPATGRGVRNVCKTLAQGGTVAMLPDQEPRPGAGAVFTPFFGTPARTMTLLARLANRTGAVVIFAWCERLSRGRGYVLHFSAAPHDISSPDLAVATLAMNRSIEELVRTCPEQYQWSYRRFRTRPAGVSGIYM
ncbi:MAG: lysophospholipid acyltransferase family protein [Gammaproteobacteria bacterium]|nr:MAG: lysophospholipid acyltransferase family protein [Gammaproteobacteria bacterium]